MIILGRGRGPRGPHPGEGEAGRGPGQAHLPAGRVKQRQTQET